MTRIAVWLFALALVPMIAGAQVIAEDSLDYGAGELDTQNGGTGWSGAWSADTARTEVATPGLTDEVGGPMPIGSGTSTALEADGDGDTETLITRSLSSSVTATFYARVLVRVDAGTVDADDFIIFWFDDDAANTHLCLNLGVKSQLLMARHTGGSEANSSTAPSTTNTALLVAKFTWGGSDFTQTDVWVDPQHNGGSEPAADATNSTGSSTCASVDQVGIRTHSLDVSDTYRFGSLLLGSTWSDVVPAGVPVELYAFDIE